MRIVFYMSSLVLFFGGSAYAASYVCPNSYQTVTTGDTMEKVKAACGEPTQANTRKEQGMVPNVLVQWVYTSEMPQAGNNRGINPYAPQMLVTFKDDVVLEISTNSQTLNTMFACYNNKRISVGSSKSDVRFACGAPSLVNTLQKAEQVNKQITTWNYNFGSYRPSINFTFEDNKLTQIEMGQIQK
ncbi:DUF2845 domain-containing protein [soil metagenome]